MYIYIGLGRITMRLPVYMGNDVITTVIQHTFISNCVYINTNNTSISTNTTHIMTSSKRLISHATDDLAWHGGCLVIAEFARRGLLLPYAIHTEEDTVGSGVDSSSSHLAVVMPYVMYAMKYDILKGNHSIGAHVSIYECVYILVYIYMYYTHLFTY